MAERAVRRIQEGTSAVLLQSGLDEKWWADSMGMLLQGESLVDVVDGTTKGVVTPVKKQEQCGSCRAFSDHEFP